MKEKEIIKNLKGLKDEINPDKSWVNSTKSQILDESDAFSSDEKRIRFTSIFNTSLFSKRKAVAFALTSVIIIFGLFGFAENSVPGDSFYSVKKLKEEGIAMLTSEVERPLYELKRANKRLEEMDKIVRENQTKNLAPAINEYKESLEEVKKVTSNQDDGKIAEEEREAVNNLEQKENEIEERIHNTLGSKATIQDIKENLYDLERDETRDLISKLIEFYEGRSKTEKQKEALDKMKEHFEKEEYEKALVNLYEISNQK